MVVVEVQHPAAAVSLVRMVNSDLVASPLHWSSVVSESRLVFEETLCARL